MQTTQSLPRGVTILRPRRVPRGVLGPRYRRWKIRWRPRPMLWAHIGGAAMLAKLLIHGGLHLFGVPHAEGW